MAITPLIPISKTLGVVRGATGLTLKTLGSISNSLSESTRDKKVIKSNIDLIRKRRDEITKRKEKQDIISAPTVVTKYEGPKTLTLNSTGQSFTSRILGFIGYLSAGWILSNMPTWVALGKQFVDRINQTSSIVTSLGNDILNFTFGVGDLFKSAFLNLKEFDFSDNSGRFKSSLDQLLGGINIMGTKINQIFLILTQPFLNIPAPGTRSPNPSAYDTPTPGPSPSGGGGKMGSIYNVDIEALATATGAAEGNYNSVGPTTWFGHGLGRYQFMTGRTDTQQILLKNAGNDKPKVQRLIRSSLNGNRSAALQLIKYFPPNDQDELFTKHTKNTLIQIKGRYPNADEFFLVQKFGVYHLTGGDFPNRRDTNGTSGKAHGDKILKEYRKIKGKGRSSSPPTSTQRPTPPPTPSGTGIQPGKRYRVGESVQGVGRISSPFGMRKHPITGKWTPHGGIDISMRSGIYISCRLPCRVVEARYQSGYGYYLDVIVPSVNLRFRFAHLSKFLIRSGEVAAGKPFALSGNSGTMTTGDHVHFEVTRNLGGTSYGGDFHPDPYVNLFIYSDKPLSVVTPISEDRQLRSSTPTQSLSPSLSTTTVQTSEGDVEMNSASLGNFMNLLRTISQEQENRKIMVIDDKNISQTSSPSVVSGGVDSPSANVNEFTLVNNFIKNKLLLDLAYL